MPHLTVHALEADIAGREAALVQSLTDSVAAVYGEWARELVNVRLIGLPAGRWGIGGQVPESVAPELTFTVREALFERPDADELVPRLVKSVTEAIASVVGEQSRPGITVNLVGTPAGRTAVGGILA